MLCEEGDETYWDRAALYALRGAFAQGFTDTAWPNFMAYSQNRLLGERSPYPIEAWPEGGMRHLSGESALYCRILTEGILGLEPLGFHRFALTPRRLPTVSRWILRNVRAFGTLFDIAVEPDGCHILFQQKERFSIPLERRSVVDFSGLISCQYEGV